AATRMKLSCGTFGPSSSIGERQLLSVAGATRLLTVHRHSLVVEQVAPKVPPSLYSFCCPRERRAGENPSADSNSTLRRKACGNYQWNGKPAKQQWSRSAKCHSRPALPTCGVAWRVARHPGRP